MSQPLNNLKLDLWFKIFIAIGAFCFILSLTVDLKVATNEVISIISLGIMLFGVGEWINHPVHAEFVNGGAIEYVKRHNRPLGIIIDLVAAALFITGAVKLITYSPC